MIGYNSIGREHVLSFSQPSSHFNCLSQERVALVDAMQVVMKVATVLVAEDVGKCSCVLFLSINAVVFEY